MSRTNSKYTRCYVDGYDMSGHARNVGTLGWNFASTPAAAYADQVLNTLPGQAEITAGPVNAMFDNTATTGFHTVFKTEPSTARVVSVVVGIQDEPVAGDPVFSWLMEQTGYQAEQGDSFVVSNLSLMPGRVSQGYFQPWGVLLHPNVATIAANSSAGIDDFGAVSTTNGGIFIYHLLTSNGTVTLTAEDAATNSDGNFALIEDSGVQATSGLINASVSPKSGFVRLTEGSTIRRYLRWQMALGSATTATFVTAFIRHYSIT